jgi:hypothetical protein
MPHPSHVIKELIALTQREPERFGDPGTLPGMRLVLPSLPTGHRRTINTQAFGQTLLRVPAALRAWAKERRLTTIPTTSRRSRRPQRIPAPAR